MSKRSIGAAVLAVTGLLAATTLAQAATKLHVAQTVKLVNLSQSATYPNPGSRAVAVGTVSGSGPSGAVLQRFRITGHPTATTYTLKGTDTAFSAHGSVNSAFSVTVSVQSDGSAKLTGSGSYTGGTGRYAKATGKFTLAGRIPPTPSNASLPNPAVVHVTGTISY